MDPPWDHRPQSAGSAPPLFTDLPAESAPGRLTDSDTSVMLPDVPSRAVTKPKPKSQVSPTTKARILEGAARAFGELGYASVRVEDIIEAAGVSRPTFYKVFASKDNVFRTLSERHHREIRSRIFAAVDGAQDAPAQLAAMIDAFLRWRAGLGPIGRVLDLEARTPGTLIADHRKATLRVMTRLAADRMQADGREPADPVMVAALIAALESIADSLLLSPRADALALERANHIGLRIAAAALADPGDPVPPIPRAHAGSG